MNAENLKPFEKGCRTREEAERIGRIAGIASGQARREKKLIRDCLMELLDAPLKELNGMTGREAMAAAAVKKAAKGDMKAFELIRDTVGEKPKTDVVLDTDRTLDIHIDVVE